MDSESIGNTVVEKILEKLAKILFNVQYSNKSQFKSSLTSNTIALVLTSFHAIIQN